jgi:hypothetical protein
MINTIPIQVDIHFIVQDFKIDALRPSKTRRKMLKPFCSGKKETSVETEVATKTNCL